MGKWRGWSIAVVVLAFGGLAGPGCSSGSGSGGSGSCKTADDCTTWQCVCNDGTTSSGGGCVFGTCASAKDVCGCDSHGGLKSATPAPSVAKSAECDAYCAKVASLNCSSNPTCDRSFDCAVFTGECAAQKRAQLQCAVDTGTWTCQNGAFSESDGCASAQCPADAGSGASDAGAE